MKQSKVFRVLIGETQTFYVDTEALNVSDAMRKIRTRLDDPKDDIVPIENNSGYRGFQVDAAYEIERKDADLE